VQSVAWYWYVFLAVVMSELSYQFVVSSSGAEMEEAPVSDWHQAGTAGPARNGMPRCTRNCTVLLFGSVRDGQSILITSLKSV